MNPQHHIHPVHWVSQRFRGYGGLAITSSLDELHAMADQIGLKHSWFQDGSFPHYDLTASKRALAVAASAVEIGLGEFPPDLLCRCWDGTYETVRQRHGRASVRRKAREVPHA